jgi:hypothetical protein
MPVMVTVAVAVLTLFPWVVQQHKGLSEEIG